MSILHLYKINFFGSVFEERFEKCFSCLTLTIKMFGFHSRSCRDKLEVSVNDLVIILSEPF